MGESLTSSGSVDPACCAEQKLWTEILFKRFKYGNKQNSNRSSRYEVCCRVQTSMNVSALATL